MSSPLRFQNIFQPALQTILLLIVLPAQYHVEDNVLFAQQPDHSPTHIHPKICSQRRPRILFPGRTTTIRKHKPALCNPSSLPAANDLRWLKGRDSGSQRSGLALLATSSITSSCDSVRFSLQRQNLNSNRRHRRCKACHNKYLSSRVVQY